MQPYLLAAGLAKKQQTMKKNVFSASDVRLFRKHQIEAIYIFGSRALGVETPLSDYDYAILTSQGVKRGGNLYHILYNIFSKISPRTLKNDVIDIIFLRDIGLELRFHVIRHGKVLYDADPTARLDFESHTTLLYCDYYPVLEQFDQTILKSI